MASKFESKCATCEGRITTNDGGANWRHAPHEATGAKHSPRPHGVMIQI